MGSGIIINGNINGNNHKFGDNLLEFIETVREMRTMQKEYFKTIGMARKSNNPELYAKAKDYKSKSIELESKVDNMLADAGKEVSNG